MLLLLSILKAFSEILAFSLIGQGILWLVVGKSRATNFVYRIFAAITRPVIRLARFITPRIVLDGHVWMVAVLIVIIVWVGSSSQKLKLCMTEAANDPLCVEIKQGLEERQQR